MHLHSTLVPCLGQIIKCHTLMKHVLVFNFPEISNEDNLLSIQSMKPKRATGEDSIPPYIHKGCDDLFLLPLKYIFNLSLKHGYFLDKFREAIVTPASKKVKRENVKDYRSISLINNIGKIFEQIYITLFLHKSIGNFLNFNTAFFQTNQHLQNCVFRKKFKCFHEQATTSCHLH